MQLVAVALLEAWVPKKGYCHVSVIVERQCPDRRCTLQQTLCLLCCVRVMNQVEVDRLA